MRGYFAKVRRAGFDIGLSTGKLTKAIVDVLLQLPPEAAPSKELVVQGSTGTCLTRAWTCRWKLALSPKVWTTETIPGRKPFPSRTAAEVSSFTVSYAARESAPSSSRWCRK